MRQNTRHDLNGRGYAASRTPGPATASGTIAPRAVRPGNCKKSETGSLIPGGMTRHAGPDTLRCLHAESPEPVFGHGMPKRIPDYSPAFTQAGGAA